MTLRCRLIDSCGYVLFFIALAAGSADLHAAQLWGIDLGSRASVDPMPIDIATGVSGPRVAVIAPQTAAGDDLASDTLRRPNLLWAVRWNVDGSRLVGFNPFTAQVTSNVLLDAPLRINGLAIDPADGTMYGNTATNLYVINPTTGVTTHVGPTGSTNALGFDALGRLLAIAVGNDLVSVNTLTGATTTIASLGRISIADIATDPDTGLLYGIGPGGLYRIDHTTAGTTQIGGGIVRPAGIAFTNVPEPATLALSILLGLATMTRRISGS